VPLGLGRKTTETVKMAVVVINDVQVLNATGASFTDAFQFEITFECTDELKEDIEWKVIYVGSAEDQNHDQELEAIMVGPLPVGQAKFVLEAPAPDWAKLPANEIRGVTVVLVTCSYKGAEFVRIGYYVNNDFTDPALREQWTNPEWKGVFVPQTMVPQLQRHILAEKPRVTRYTVAWDQPLPQTGFGAAAGGGGAAAAVAPAAAAAGGGMDMGEDDNLAMPIAAGGL